MEQKAKNSGSLKRLFFRMIGPQRTENFLRSRLIKKYGTPPIQLPVDTGTVHRVLCVLSKQPVDAVHQIGSVLSLMALFKHARMSLLCTPEILEYVKNIQGADIVEYDEADSPIFSRSFEMLATALHNEIDICIVLDPDPGLAILYLAGRTAATIRAGYETAGAWPFLNFKLKPQTSERFRGEWFHSIADMFGARPVKRIRWSISKDTLEEIKHSMNESKLKCDGTAIGVDLLFFERRCGVRWSESLVNALRQAAPGPLFIYTHKTLSETTMERLRETGLPVITTISIPRIAALASISRVLITGNTVLCALSRLIDAQLIGIFEEKEAIQYCPELPNVTGITFTSMPDDATIQAILSAIK